MRVRKLERQVRVLVAVILLLRTAGRRVASGRDTKPDTELRFRRGLAPFANREYVELVLKPQDLVVALKLASMRGEPWTYSSLGADLGMSASGVHESVQRAIEAGLLSGDGRRAIRAAILEFVVHGVKYAFPAKRGAMSRGLPTGTSASPLSEKLGARGATPLVWADRNGTVRGESVTPLYPAAPRAASRDPKLYALLAVTDALRTGTAREREVATSTLRELLAA